MRALRITLVTVVLVLGMLSAAHARAAKHGPVDGVFVGQVVGPLRATVFIAVVAGEEGFLAYLCDNKDGVWFSSDERTGNSFDLTSKDGSQSLEGILHTNLAAGSVSYKGRRYPFVAPRVHGDAGLYRVEGDDDGTEFLAGWIVLKNGRQVGSVGLAGLTSTAPALVTSNPTLVLNQTQVAVAQVVTPANGSVLVLDIAGDGIDVGGQTTTSLLSGTPEAVRWTKPGDDDAFLAVNATALRSFGYEIRTASGQLVDGTHLFGGGKLKNTATGVTTVITDAWQMVKSLDKNNDGLLNASDPAWDALRLYRDSAADGDIDAADLVSVSSSILSIRFTGVPAGSFTDQFGNIHVARGIFRRLDQNVTIGIAQSIVLQGL